MTQINTIWINLEENVRNFLKKYKKVIDKKEKQMYSYIKGGMKSLPQI